MRIELNQLQTKNIEDPAVSAVPAKNGSSKSTLKSADLFSINTDGILFGHSEDNILSRDRIKKKTVADQAAEASALGVETQMDQMLVVAQTMSPMDAQKLSEEGYDMGELDPSEAVNSLDRMKIRLAEAGVNVAGYTDTISADKVAEVTGQTVDSGILASERSENIINIDSASVYSDPYFTPESTDVEIAKTLKAFDLPASNENILSVREAINMTSELKDISENTKMFLASDEMEPTIQNVFIAEYSSGKADFGSQARFVAEDTGYLSRTGNVNPTKQNEISASNNPNPELDRQISDIIEKAGFVETDEIKNAALRMIGAGIPLTAGSVRSYEDAGKAGILPIKREIMEAIAAGRSGKEAYLISGYKAIKAERVSKEAALSMAADTNLKNIDKDRRIDTGYLERDVESLKEKEKDAFDLLERTLSVKSDILAAPSELIADSNILDLFSKELKKTTESIPGPGLMEKEAVPAASLADIHEKAAVLEEKYERMAQTYEAVGTEVRADLGDNIKKAFANTDFAALLKDLGVTNSIENERAVRIASYSKLELTSENIEKISEADARLTRLLDNLTPSRVLRLIRDNVNPLEVSIRSLEDKLSEYEEKENRPIEDFAKYLVSERDRGNITEEEATSYIGIYRFVNSLNNGDHRAVGALVATGAELNFANLLSAIRTGNKGHIDRYIDENFGGLDAKLSGNNTRIDQMIRSAFSPDSDQPDQDMYEEDSRKFAEAAKAEAEIYRALEEADIPRSANNITAYEQLTAERGSRFAKELYDSASSRSRERMKKAGEKVLNSLIDGDSEKIRESFDEMVKAELIGALEGEKLDIRALQSKDKILSVKGALADSGEYNVPTEFKGEIININLKLRHGENQNSVDIYFETDDFGSVHAGLRVTDGIRGVITCERAAGDDYMRDRLGRIVETVSGVSGKNTDLYVGNREIPDEQSAMDGKKAGSAELYRIAKAVLDSVLSD